MSNFSYKFDNRRETKVYQKLLIYANIILHSKLIVFSFFLMTRFKLCKKFHAATISKMVSSWSYYFPILLTFYETNFYVFALHINSCAPHLVLDRTLRRFANSSEEWSDIFRGMEVQVCLRWSLVHNHEPSNIRQGELGEIRTFPYFTSSVKHCPCLTV